jgi:anti-sigma factor RsiW
MRKLIIGEDIYNTGAELPDEALIMAYVDDELDQEGRRYVEDLLARSAEAREIAELMRSSSALLKSAFLDDPDCGAAGRTTPAVKAPENPDALPAPPTGKPMRLCRPMAGTVTQHTRVQRKA